MTSLLKNEDQLVWEARKLWAQHKKIRVTLNSQAILTPIVGLIDRVSVTGAFIVVDGWHIPMYAVKAFGKPTERDMDRYRRALAKAREEAFS